MAIFNVGMTIYGAGDHLRNNNIKQQLRLLKESLLTVFPQLHSKEYYIL